MATTATLFTNKTLSITERTLIVSLQTHANSSDSFQTLPNYMRIWMSDDLEYYRYVIFLFIMNMSFLGNSLIIVTIAFTSSLRRVTNYFLVNLAVADLLVTVTCMPINFAQWLNNDVSLVPIVCKFRPFIQGTSVCLTIYTLTLIGVDRYRVILNPLGKRITKIYFRLILAGIWIASMITVGPSLFVYRVGTVQYGHENVTYCDEFGWSKENSVKFTYTLLTLNYLLPILVFTSLYGRIFFFLWYREIPGLRNMPDTVQTQMKKKFMRRKKLIRMLLFVVITFIICHLPQNAMTILWYTKYIWGYEQPHYLRILGFHSEIILYLNTAINPVVYGFLHGKIKASSIVILKWLFCCKSRAGQIRDKKLTQRSFAMSERWSTAKLNASAEKSPRNSPTRCLLTAESALEHEHSYAA